MATDENVKKIGKKMAKNEARKWVKQYKNNHPLAENPTYGWLYGADILRTLLDYDGAGGIWFYKGIADDGSERLVLFPADADGNILDKGMKSLGAAVKDDDEPADDGNICPPYCPDN